MTDRELDEKARECLREIWARMPDDQMDIDAPILVEAFKVVDAEARREEAERRMMLRSAGNGLRGSHGEKCRYAEKDECPAVQAWDKAVEEASRG